MRLKYLLFPIVLLISVAIFIGFIWPEIRNMKIVKAANDAKKIELQALLDKKIKVAEIENRLNDEAGIDNIITEYLPEVKKEEKIISGVNYLANSFNVTLVDVSMVGTNNSKLNEEPSLESNYLTDQSVAAVDPLAAPVVATKVQSVPVKISIVGRYEDIKSFLNGLQKISLFNSIKSVGISKQSVLTKVAIGEDVSAEEQQKESTNLVANVEIDFGYMKTAKIDNAEVQKLKTSLDGETIKALKQYVSPRSQSMIGGDQALDDGTAGKINPFFAN